MAKHDELKATLMQQFTTRVLNRYNALPRDAAVSKRALAVNFQYLLVL